MGKPKCRTPSMNAIREYASKRLSIRSLPPNGKKNSHFEGHERKRRRPNRERQHRTASMDPRSPFPTLVQWFIWVRDPLFFFQTSIPELPAIESISPSITGAKGPLVYTPMNCHYHDSGLPATRVIVSRKAPEKSHHLHPSQTGRQAGNSHN